MKINRCAYTLHFFFRQCISKKKIIIIIKRIRLMVRLGGENLYPLVA